MGHANSNFYYPGASAEASHFQCQENRRVRRARNERFERKQKTNLRFVRIADLVEYRATENGTPAPSKLESGWKLALDAATSGDFECAKPQLLCLSEEDDPRRLDKHFISARRKSVGDSDTIDGYLRWCWLPLDLALRWCEKKKSRRRRLGVPLYAMA